MTPAEEAERQWQRETTAALIDSVSAMETLIEDMLTLIAGVTPEPVEEMRDHAAAMAQQIADGRASPDDAKLGGFYGQRLSILRTALERIGRPYLGAEVVSLADMRRASKAGTAATTTVRYERDHPH